MPSKYGNKKTAYNGRTFDSKREADHAARLDMLRFAKDPSERVVDISYQHKISIDINGNHVCNYIADFQVKFGDGHVETQDAKGFKTEVYKLKRKLVKALHGIDIVEV